MGPIYLKRFLGEVTQYTDAEDIYLIGHSMGNRALVGAVEDILSEQPSIKSKLREIILAAPDIDADVFVRDIAPQITFSPSTITLYASSEDKALAYSKRFNGNRRAGDTTDGPVIVEGIDTIDATGTDTSFLRHSYFGNSKSIIADMFYVIRWDLVKGSPLSRCLEVLLCIGSLGIEVIAHSALRSLILLRGRFYGSRLL